MKKVLSWVLVLALVLGSFSMAFAGDTDNASNMKDAAQIKNVEAVDVMVATGIIGGYPDGNFYPEKTVTRAEMAKMICIAVNGGEDVGSYYASSCKFADSKNHWAAGYIAYCANEGIIDGRSADVFDPDATVTGSEAAKMMLVALGYSAKIEKLTGEQWEANTLKLAKANKLFDGCDNFVAGAPLTRDNAAQIIFNGLIADTVDYDTAYEITTGDTTVTVNAKVNKVKAGNLNTNSNEFLQLYEKAFEKDLVKANEETGDGFGRPAHTWTLEKDKIGTYADEADYTFVVDKAQSLADAVKDYDDDITLDSGLKSILNGVTPAEANAVEVGDVVELYDDNDKDSSIDTAVVVRYSLEKITSVDKDVSSSDAKKDVTCYVYVGDTKVKDTDFAGFDAKTYVEDTYIAAVVKGREVLASYIPEKKTGEVTKYNTSAVYLDGTKYGRIGGYLDVDNKLKAGDKFDLYVDVNGYAMGSVLVEGEDDTLYGVYLGYKKDTGFQGDDTPQYTVKILTADGEVTYDVDEDKILGTTVEGYAPKKLVAYQLNKDGEIDSANFESISLNSSDVSAKGIVAGVLLNKDVAAFEWDTTDKEWTTYGYNDLLEATVEGTYFTNDDGEIAAIELTSYSDGTSNDVLGFYVDSDKYTVKDGEVYYDVTLLVNGEEKTYSTVVGNDTTDAANKFFKEETATGKVLGGDYAVTALLKVTLNSKGEVKNAGYAEFQTSLAPVKDSDFAKDFVAYKTNVSGKVNKPILIKGVSGDNVQVNDSENNNPYFNIAGATKYRLSVDADDNNKLSLAKFNGTLLKNGYIVLMQLDEDSNAWDTVVYITATDAAALTQNAPVENDKE